jgi:ketosteroid isomerase-like protein
MRPPCNLPASFGALLLAAPLAAQAPTDSAAIHDLSRQFSAAYVRGDVAAMVAIYTPDAVIFPERADMMTGTDALRRYWALAPGARVTRHVATPVRIVVQGDAAYDYGNYEVSGVRANGQVWGPTLGKYVIVWVRTQAGWRMQLDIWNSRTPPAP